MSIRKSIISGDLRRRIKKYEIAGAVFNAASASLLHFTYELSGREVAAALFSAVNESVWEHVKIFTLPYVFWAFAELFCLRCPFRKFVCAKVLGLYTMTAGIPVLFYTYTGITGKSYFIADMLIGFSVMALSYAVSFRALTSGRDVGKYFTLAAVLFLLYCIAAAFFTFAPPKLPLFRDPITGAFGAARQGMLA